MQYPASYVTFMGEKFYTDSNMVFIDGHEDDPNYVFAFPGEVATLEVFPDGVRVQGAFPENYLIHTLSGELKDASISILSEEESQRRDIEWRKKF